MQFGSWSIAIANRVTCFSPATSHMFDICQSAHTDDADGRVAVTIGTRSGIAGSSGDGDGDGDPSSSDADVSSPSLVSPCPNAHRSLAQSYTSNSTGIASGAPNVTDWRTLTT